MTSFPGGSWFLVPLLFGGRALSAPATVPDEPATTITPRELWSTCFGGDEVKLGFIVHSSRSIEGQLAWSHSARHRTIARSELAVSIDGHKRTEVVVSLRLPEVREGVVLDTELCVQLANIGGDVLAEHRRPLRIYSRDPFADRRAWLRRLQVVVFDPRGKTEATFDDAGVPYRSIRDLAALAATRKGMVVIGEGTSISSHPALPEILTAVASDGLAVLWLAPVDGRLAFPGTGGPPGPSQVALRRSDVIRRFDKHLDSEAWPPEGDVVAARFEVVSHRGRVLLSVTADPTAWPWLEATYPGGGRMILCGFGIIRSWDAGPTPRYLLARILERLSQDAELP